MQTDFLFPFPLVNIIIGYVSYALTALLTEIQTEVLKPDSYIIL